MIQFFFKIDPEVENEKFNQSKSRAGAKGTHLRSELHRPILLALNQRKDIARHIPTTPGAGGLRNNNVLPKEKSQN